jgi:NTE family protein
MAPGKMEKLLRAIDYRRFCDKSARDRIPLAGPALSIALENGVYEGDYLKEWLGNELAELGVETFADLGREDESSSLAPEQEYRLVVMTADITRGELVRLPWDYRDRYGLDPGKQRVVDAVRASMSIPIFYEPVTLTHADGSQSTLVDGGVLTNYPIGTFDRTDGRAPRWPTFGFTLTPPLPAGNAKLFHGLGPARRGPFRLVESLITTMMVGHDQAYLTKPWVAARSILVDTGTVNAVDFGIDRTAQERLYQSGLAAGRDFLKTWDWEEYLRLFRGGAPAGTPAPQPA